jgi:hypothetical protein
MKKLCTCGVVFIGIAACFILLNGCGKKAPQTVKTEKVAPTETTSFDEVTSKLDPGGNLYLYMSTEQWLANLSGKIGQWRDLAASIPELQNDQRVSGGFNVVTQLVKDSGIEKISGVGMSSIAREPGVYYTKMVVHHYAGQGDGFLWTMFGKAPHELAGLDLLPANTAAAAFYDVDAKEVWSVIQKECEQSGIPEASAFLKTMPQEFEKNAGMKWSDVVDSLGGEVGFVMTLDDTHMVTVPLPTQNALSIPEPALMVAVKVNNEAIFDRIDQELQKNQKRLIRVDKDGLKMRTVPVPVPIPITFRPSVATGEGYLFFATSDTVIQEALAVKKGKAGLKSTEEFKKLSAGVPMQGNQFCFLSQRFGQTVMKVQQESMEMNNSMPPQLKGFIESMMQPDKAGFVFAVGANTDEGWIMVANGNQSGGKVLLSSAAVPAVLGAVALQGMSKAKEKSQPLACINNLRQIDAAKQQWALERNKTASDIPTWNDLIPYLGRNGKQLRCPGGGQYTIGAVGERPTCSHSGHELP